MRTDGMNDLENALQPPDRLRMEETMIQAEKLISVGGLAAGMAHEINNPLACILQGIQVIEDRIAPAFPPNRQAAHDCGTSMDALNAYCRQRRILRFLASMRESAERAAAIVENMLSFSRKSGSTFWPHNLGKLWDKAITLAENEYSLKRKYDFRDIIIERHYAPDLPKAPCDAVKIQQVFLNLLKNAAQAMDRRQNNTEPPKIIIRTAKEGKMARIEIQDNGPGMTEPVRSRIFEPFFTTKAAGKGTGLGLSVSYFIITDDHGGTMDVRSEQDKGTTFIIRLPLIRKGRDDGK